MRTILRSFIQPTSNIPEAAKLLIDLLKVKITKTTLTKDLEEHPDFPSLLSISDVLNRYGVDNLAINIDPEKLGVVPVPFITPIRGEKNGYKTFFTVVRGVSDTNVVYYDPERYKWALLPREEFLQRFSGTVLLADVEAEVHKGEADYERALREENRKRFFRQAIALFLPVIVLVAGIGAILQNGVSALLPFLFSLLTLVGAVIGVLLLWYEVDQYNPILKQICSAGKKVNCGAILQSKASRIAGISWSAIGVGYFMGQLDLLLFNGIVDQQVLFIASWLNVLAIPYVFYSVYYQWRIAKQWCTLCLSVQMILVLQFAIALSAGWHTSFGVGAFVGSAITIITAFAIPSIALVLLLPALQKAKEARGHRIQLHQLKYNTQVFEALLNRQKAIAEPVKGVGISLGNPNGKYKLIKVCSPYCGPCGKAHTPLEELLETHRELQVQIVFTATNREGDIRALPVRHLLAVSDGGDEDRLKQALDDWYLPEEKNIKNFAAKYPFDEEKHDQFAQIEAMSQWCNKVKIEFTPTFFLSHPSFSEEGQESYHQLPSVYGVNDLKYLLA